ncbi:hypothetical protein [Nocardia sp. AG03]|uniref:hypothetical protein n=1 Tax=Nocardia sp. AG03 TaxID=3025312 RepID=UPI0024182C67|nr:hypothetical protein [Nocardia sp. AG03]
MGVSTRFAVIATALLGAAGCGGSTTDGDSADAGGLGLRIAPSAGGKGYIDGTVLPRAGRYTVLVDPHGDTTGQTRIRLSTATDQRLTLRDPLDQLVDSGRGIATLRIRGE